MASIFSTSVRRGINAPANFSLIFFPLFYSPGRSPIFNRLAAASSTAPPRFFSSSKAAHVLADENMGRLIQDRVNEYKKSKNVPLPLPENSPFEIVSYSSNATLTLRRDFQRENILVVMEESDRGFKIRIDKGEGTTLMFWCHVDQLRLEFQIWNVEFEPRQDGPHCHYEYSQVKDKSLERALVKYLAARGFDRSFLESIYLAKKKREKKYFDWLKKIKYFFIPSK